MAARISLEGKIDINTLVFPVIVRDPSTDMNPEFYATKEELLEKYDSIYAECVEEYDEDNDVDFLFKLRGY